MFSPTKILRDTVDLSIHDVVVRLGSLGLTNVEISSVLGIGLADFERVLKEDDDLYRLLLEAKENPNRAVETALFKKCIGYEVKETTYDANGKAVSSKVRETVPDTTAISFWLKNRDKTRWSEHTRLDVNISLADRLTAAHERVLENKKMKEIEGERVA